MEIISKDQALTFDDLNLVPADFSEIKSRALVNTEQKIGDTVFKLPILSSNMTSVFTTNLANKLQELGGKSIIHRFCTVEENIKLFKASKLHGKSWCSVGASKEEMERAKALVDAGVEVLVLDMAMGNSANAVTQYNRLLESCPYVDIVVSDFSLGPQIIAFNDRVKKLPMAYTIGQGCGSACKTREVTGIGIPVMSAIQSCTQAGNFNLILNGGIRNSGDFSKALASGVKACIIGRLFAQCRESSDIYDPKFAYFSSEVSGVHKNAKTYSGSASNTSYVSQGKEAEFRAPEGESFQVDVNTTVTELYNNFNGGLRSSMSYLNSSNLEEFRANAKFVKVSSAGSRESSAYGKNL